MTPAEMKLMKEMMRDVLGEALPPALEPIKKEIDGLKMKVGGMDLSQKDAARKIQRLEEVDRKHSGGIRQVREDIVPRLQSETDEVRRERARDLSATTGAYQQMVDLFDALAERQGHTEKELRLLREETADRAKKTSFEVKDTQGNVSLVPAAIVAAQSAHRAEGKTDALAVDVDSAAKLARSTAKWQKAFALLAGLAALLEGIYHIIAALK